MMQACTIKRKAAEEVVAGGQLFRPLQECITKRKAEEAVGCGEAEDAAAGEKAPGHPLDPSPETDAPPPHYQEALKPSNPDLARLPGEEMDEENKERLCFPANAFYQMEERFPRLQEWVREELNTKGYVEMDDDWVKRRAEAQAALDEGWKKIEALLLSVTKDEDDADDESDYDDADDESDYGGGGGGGDDEEEEQDKQQVQKDEE